MKSVYQPIILEALSELQRAGSRTILDYLNISINPSTFYYSLRRLESLGLIKVDRTKRFNSYIYLAKYKKFSYSIRVTETGSNKPRNKWGAKGETVVATVTGIVPFDTTEDQIKRTHKERLFDKMLEILSDKDPPVLAIPARYIKIDDMTDRGVSGVEFKDFVSEFDPDNEIEVEFTNSQGTMYNRRDGFEGTYQTRIDDYIV